MKKVLLTILDGFGLSNDTINNPLKEANLRNLRKLSNMYPSVRLDASGRRVGLQKGIPASSEIAHMSIGSGRVIKQNIMQMDDLFDSKGILTNASFKKMVEYVNSKDIPLHIMVLLSDSGIHSHIKYVLEMIDILHQVNVSNLYIHAILDGKDTKNKASYFLDEVNSKLKFYRMGHIASICGRLYAMDKDKDYSKTKKYYDLITRGSGILSTNYKTTLKEQYEKGYTDFDMPPILLNRKGIIKDRDVLLCMNYRKDRMLQVLQALFDTSNDTFERIKVNDLNLYTMYNIKELADSMYFLDTTKIECPLGVYLSSLGLTQARIADESRHSHINFYFDGCQDLALDNCDKFLISSKESDKEGMDSISLTKKTIKCMENDYDFVIVNLSAADRVAHYSDYEATKRNAEIIDICLGKLYEVAQDNFYTMFIMGNHGNCEDMGIIGHTLNQVPLIVTDDRLQLVDGDLTNVAPTILKYMDIAIPLEMQNTNLLYKQEKGN